MILPTRTNLIFYLSIFGIAIAVVWHGELKGEVLQQPSKVAAKAINDKTNVDAALKATGISELADKADRWVDKIEEAAREIAIRFAHYLSLRDKLQTQAVIAREIHDSTNALSSRRNWTSLFIAIHVLKVDLDRDVRFTLNENDKTEIANYMKGTPTPTAKAETRPAFSAHGAKPDEQILALRRRLAAAQVLRDSELAVPKSSDLKVILQPYFNDPDFRPVSPGTDYGQALERLKKLAEGSEK